MAERIGIASAGEAAMTAPLAVDVRRVSHRYGKTTALESFSLSLPAGESIALVGPDGVGKSTLLALIAGVKILQSGSLHVFGQDIADRRARQALSRRIAFMPQGLGYNLYPTLSIDENIDFHARLFSIPAAEREARIERLLSATDLLRFRDRPAGKLSGGMKQKLSLCCALVHDPELLILDEPTTGVDPLSRRQFWQLIADLRRENPRMTVLVATAYIDEAEQFEQLIAMDEGKLLIHAPTAEVIAQYAGTASPDDEDISHITPLERAYHHLLPEDKRGDVDLQIPPFQPEADAPPAMEAEGLSKRFGDFTAVDNVSFRIEKGEIFGFLGSNGCGKSTTMKMLTGLLEPSEGHAELLGEAIEAGSIEMRMRVGYMSQAFSLYEEMSVRKNLEMHATLYRLRGSAARKAVQDALTRYQLAEVADILPRHLSLGLRQRLQLAAACLHHPEVLILDEPTSGVDPAARDLFWQELGKLSREERITIFVSTHFMSEAARCDRISFMHRGRVLDMGTPRELCRRQDAANLEEAFIRYLEAAEEAPVAAEDRQDAEQRAPIAAAHTAPQSGFIAWLSLLWTFARRESKELLRDPVRLFFALFGPVLMMVSAAAAISFDVRAIDFAVWDQDQSAESRALLAHFRGSPYFCEQAPLSSAAAKEAALKSGRAALVIEIPSGFAKDMLRQSPTPVAFLISGSEPFLAENIKGMVLGIVQSYSAEKLQQSGYPLDFSPPLQVQARFAYNQDFKSIYAITPGVIMMALMLIPVMMTTLGVVREKEIGSISNLYTSPASVAQFLLGKQLPYIGAGLLSFLILVLLAVLLFDVPIHGSFFAMLLGAYLLIFAVTAFGLLVSSVLSSQVAAMASAAILTMIPAMNFSGMLYPVSTITGGGRIMAAVFPAAHFQRISLGAFTKGQSFADFLPNYAALLAFALGCLSLAIMLLRKQEK